MVPRHTKRGTTVIWINLHGCHEGISSPETQTPRLQVGGAAPLLACTDEECLLGNYSGLVLGFGRLKRLSKFRLGVQGLGLDRFRVRSSGVVKV